MAFSGILVPGTMLSNAEGERYRIDALLGSGGFGIAYTALDATTNDVVVVKILRPDVAADPNAAIQYAREAEAARLVQHINVARTLAHIEARDSGIGAPYLVMEYVSGGDLSSRLIAQGDVPLDQTTLLDWMTQLSLGLQAIHEHVLHRDIKPQNVLMDGVTLKISDFGMSKYIEAATRTVTFKGAGTPFYMAPETWQNQRATRATDIYSLGVMFYQAVTYHYPFVGADMMELRQAHLFTPAPRPQLLRATLDDRLDGMIVRMLEKRPADRYQAVEEIVRILAQISAAQLPGGGDRGLGEVVRGACRTYDNRKIVQAQQSAQDEADHDAAAAINYQMIQLASQLDGLAETANQRLLEAPIVIQKLTSGAFVDWATGMLRSYGFFDKSLDLGFLALSPSDVLMEYDPMPGVDLPFQTKKLATREVTIDGASIVAIGFLKLSASTHERFGGVTFTRPIGDSYERGLHLLLLRAPGELYGFWKTCEIEDQPLVSQGSVRRRLLLSEARDIVIAVEERNSLAQYVVKLRDFSDADFVALLTELVSP